MTMFRNVGPFEIVRQIGRGMNPVFLATDTRSGASVALKVIAVGTDEEAREILEAERQGADLQRKFSELTQYVPRVYEVGLASDYFFIAMEYIAGEDLSTILARGPLPPDRAVSIAIQLCRFLEEVDRVAGVEGESVLTLLHNDLKPGNIRVEDGDRVKILDFGAAKVLSLSKRVTRNVFGSIPYLSPECLETGKRDRHTDAWALGVLLYEMVAGRSPFRADNTVSLEHRICSRQPPEPPAGIPANLQAVISRLLAPYPADRYASASAIGEDLERVLAGEAPEGEPASGDAARQSVDEPVTRRTRRPVEDEPPTRAMSRPPLESSTPAADSTPPIPARGRMAGFRRAVITAMVVLIVAVVGNEMLVARRANRLAASVPLQEFGGFNSTWTEYTGLARRSYLGGIGVYDLRRALLRQSEVLAERVIANYRTPTPTVRETQWQNAAGALRHALTIEPGNTRLRAFLRYAEGHLHRIDGEANKSRREYDQARRELADAITSFREAAALHPEWPDPYLGLARTFIYGIEDIDRGADALNEAQERGYAIGARETAQLGDGYRVRGETLQRAAESIAGLPQERESLTRAAEAYQRALDLYSKITDFADVPARIRATQNRLAIVERRLERPERSRSNDDPADGSSAIDRLLRALSEAW